MLMRPWRTLVLGSVLVALAGCEARPPLAPEPINAQLPGHGAIYGARRGEGDVAVFGRCLSSTEYARTSKGDWDHHWHLVRVEVLAVEKGMWEHPHLTFVAVRAWPKPESGIMLAYAPWPYRPGLAYLFTLSTAAQPALIAGQEPRGQ